MSNLEVGLDLGAEAAKFSAKKEEPKPTEASIDGTPQPENAGPTDVESGDSSVELAEDENVHEGEGAGLAESTDEDASEKRENSEADEGETSEKAGKIKEITELSEKIEAIDAEMAALRGSLEETKQQLSEVRKSLGLEESDEPSPDDEKIKQLLEIRQQLIESSRVWAETNGRESLPEGLVREIDDENLESKGASFDRNYERKYPDLREAIENLARKIREVYIEEFKKETVESFEKALRRNFRLGTAKNINQVIELMKIRVPNAIDKKSESFISGDAKEPPFSAVWIQCKSSSIFEILSGKPNFIKKLDISFDDEVVNLADEEALGAKIADPESTSGEGVSESEAEQNEEQADANREDEETSTS